ncbi:aminoacyl-tRNA hydrolase [Desulfolucanica intricata]|uniref:aminoacyl-tRNA hydrolase n=1 Tax=Desulfolucanica intricata TaxID=1285191 RepID=UPI00082F4E53|nr:aminoacyl-tRNA hydrolase [Desulfolucanica intricata]
MKLIVGLGNPGPEYINTRHNIGFKVIEKVAEKSGTSLYKKMFRALIGQTVFEGQKIILAKPQTYMNLSGLAVASLLSWYKLSPEELLVVYDDFNLELGRLRLRKKGSAGGHNGMKSIIRELGTDNFPRLRFGIGKPASPGPDQSSYVLGKFSTGEIRVVEEGIDTAVEAISTILSGGIENAMNKFNRTKPLDQKKQLQEES